jgi:hypothetical protein
MAAIFELIMDFNNVKIVFSETKQAIIKIVLQNTYPVI